MALSAKLELRQSQQLVMTPQLQQAIRLLQLSNLELNAFVETELERNPLLERDAEAPVPAPERDFPDAVPATAGSADGGLDFAAPGDTATRDLDTDAADAFPESGASDLGPDLGGSWAAQAGGRSSQGSDEDANLEEYVTGRLSLRNHLETQIGHVLTDPIDRLVGINLIDLVDEAGYLRADLDEVAARLGISIDRLEAILARLQGLDPVGVFARDLRECLAIQLREQGRLDPMMVRFLDNLPLLAARNMTALRRAVGADAEDLADMIAEVRRLNPKPGLEFGSVDVEPVVPDVLVRMGSDGSWLVELNSETLPRVLINRVYYTRVTRNTRSEKDKEFLLDCLQSANWLVKSLDQRARTILRVAEEIVRQQDRFLVYGVQHLRPLNLKTVADAIKMHESTVSRVTSNKYMATPRGIFELKYFFTSAIASAGDGEAHSSESVRHRIRTLIDAESPDDILSDDKLVEILGKDGIDIARRTVAKYREAMRIPSSVQRRREKKLACQAVA
ncbi:MAG: RNA polymerase factor sigma-54 [Hyphomicrobiaceae bacterium]|nr:RNA polymerase factor sigma-54 [Hyphomicrobiaceae bacterium]